MSLSTIEWMFGFGLAADFDASKLAKHRSSEELMNRWYRWLEEFLRSAQVGWRVVLQWRA